MQSNLAPGARFPDYEFTNHATKRRRLSELQGQDPMVLLLSHGGYCPKDRRRSNCLWKVISSVVARERTDSSDFAPLAGDPAEVQTRMRGANQKCDTSDG